MDVGRQKLASDHKLDRVIAVHEPELEAFLYAGFGSMPADQQTGRTIIEAVRAAGRRVVLSQGWAEEPLPAALGDALDHRVAARAAAIAGAVAVDGAAVAADLIVRASA